MSFIIALLANLFVGAVDAAKTSQTAKENQTRSEEKVKQWEEYQKSKQEIIEKVNSQYRNQLSK